MPTLLIQRRWGQIYTRASPFKSGFSSDLVNMMRPPRHPSSTLPEMQSTFHLLDCVRMYSGQGSPGRLWPTLPVSAVPQAVLKPRTSLPQGELPPAPAPRTCGNSLPQMPWRVHLNTMVPVELLVKCSLISHQELWGWDEPSRQLKTCGTNADGH